MKLEHPWVFLSGITVGGDYYVEIMAAACFDGIGVIASWRLDMNGKWKVWAVDTEQSYPIEVFDEGECVPPSPPVL
jgi:hypothetical protein